MRKRTSIGVAELTLMSMEGKFGGAAERGAKTSQGASFLSMYLKMMRMMKRMLGKIEAKIRI